MEHLGRRVYVSPQVRDPALALVPTTTIFTLEEHRKVSPGNFPGSSRLAQKGQLRGHFIRCAFNERFARPVHVPLHAPK